MVLSDMITVQPGGIHGHCWFANQRIPKDTPLWWKGDTVYHDRDVPKSEIITWTKEKQEKFMSLAYQVAPSVYRGTDPSLPCDDIDQAEQNEYFVNHSCDGNAWYENDDLLVAMRDIEPNEEIVYDYALTESDEEWILAPKCLCGKAACRGLVTGNDWKLPELQQKYNQHFTAHILSLIKKPTSN